MACGAVVVASATTAVREAVGDAAITVDPEDVDAIARGILTAIGDEAARESVRSRVPSHLARFDWDRTAEETMRVYRAALGPHHRSARSR
jgi:glycosyltransferase involved in cell wall biosynthesis